MYSSSKRRYPGSMIRAAAGFCGICFGLYLIAILSSESLLATELPDYARKILNSDRTLTRRDVAIIYTLSHDSSYANFSRPIRISLSSFLGWERADVSEDVTGNYFNTAPTKYTIVSSGGGRCRYFERQNRSEDDTDPGFNRAALCAYMDAVKGGPDREQLTIRVSSNSGFGVPYLVTIDRMTPRLYRSYEVQVTKDFRILHNQRSIH
jgi:hypothetical protein